MTYIDYLNAFNQWLESNALPGNAQLLYFKFLDVFNRAGWPEYVQVDTLRLMLMVDAGAATTAIRARDKLAASGFLSYEKGKKGAPNKYRLKNATVSATISATISATENDTVSAIHIKTKTKTKERDADASPKKPLFSPPTAEEAKAYCAQYGIEAERFVDYYAAQGWKLSNGNGMEDWRAAVRNWARKMCIRDSPPPPLFPLFSPTLGTG